MTRDDVHRILASGAQAPSGDNLQPWRVEWEGDGCRISVDRERDCSLYNFQHRASLIAVGAMVENMRIAARESGFDCTPRLHAPGQGELPSVELHFRPVAEPPDPLFPAIEKRCTNRRPYSRTPLPSSVLDTLTRAAATLQGAELRFVQDRREMRLIARAASLNDRLLFELRALHEPFFETIRWSERSARDTQDGLFIRTLELGALEPGFRAMRRWPLVRLANLFGNSLLAPTHSFRTFLRSGAFGVLRFDAREPDAYVLGGQALQRVWLAATAAGLAFQPMAGMFYLVSWVGQAAAWADSHRALLARASRLFGPAVMADEGHASIMLFRIGHGPAPTATSVRRPLTAG